MKDRYLSRGKRADNGEWAEGYYAYMRPHHYIMPKGSWDCWCRIDGKTLCQCTGLKDKNGKLIWENDIVRHYNNPSNSYACDVGMVLWDDDKFEFVRTSRTAGENVKIGRHCVYEVIGNKFDNPELLEVQE